MMDIGISWYREEQYSILLQYSVDGDLLSPTYEGWLKNAEKNFILMQKQGLNPHKIPIDVNDMMRWCQIKGYEMDGAARSEYIAIKTQEIYG